MPGPAAPYGQILPRRHPGHGSHHRNLFSLGRGEGEGLEQQVRCFIWLRSLGLLRCPVVIADVGLSPAGWELALRLTARWPEVILWPAADLAMRKPAKLPRKTG